MTISNNRYAATLLLKDCTGISMITNFREKTKPFSLHILKLQLIIRTTTAGFLQKKL